jgi:LPXTG-motif cell wall-anchored protein
LIALCLGIFALSGPAASATVSPRATTSPAATCDTSDLAFSTPSSAEDTTVYSTGTRAIDPVTLRNTSSVDCPDSGFIVLLLPNPVSEPEPTLEWSIGGGSWHGTSLSWDNGVVNGNASCASPCWKAGIVTLDVPAHTTYTIDLAVIFHSGMNSGFFSGAVYYTAQAVTDDGASGGLVAWAYLNQAGSSTGSGGSGSGGTTTTTHHSPTPAPSSHTATPSPSASPSPKASATPTPSAATTSATPTTVTSPPATDVATPSLAPVADAHSGGSGPSTAIALTAVVLLALAAGAGYVLRRRRKSADHPRSAE